MTKSLIIDDGQLQNGEVYIGPPPPQSFFLVRREHTEKTD